MDLLSAMRVFVKVVEAGSLSTAARELEISQPTVSERLARLEDYLHDKLLHRTTRSVKVTETGLLFYERCRKVLEAAARAEGVTSRHGQGLCGTVRVSAPFWIGEMVLPQILVRFRRAHPLLNVDLRVGNERSDPLASGVDVALHTGRAAIDGCAEAIVGSVPLVMVASPEYLGEYGTPQVPDDLKHHVFMHRVDSDEDRSEITPAYAGKVAWSVNHWRPLVSLLSQGAGIGIVEAPIAAEAMASGQLCRVLPDCALPQATLRLLHDARDDVPERTRLFVDFLLKELRTYSYFNL